MKNAARLPQIRNAPSARMHAKIDALNDFAEYGINMAAIMAKAHIAISSRMLEKIKYASAEKKDAKSIWLKNKTEE